MKILVVEDNEDRISWFLNNFDGHDVTICTDAHSGSKEVTEKAYDLILLDHDLGGQVYVNSNDENTGFQVAKLIKGSINKNTPVIIHSWNPAGAENIRRILSNSIYLPFGTFRADDIVKNLKVE